MNKDDNLNNNDANLWDLFTKDIDPINKNVASHKKNKETQPNERKNNEVIWVTKDSIQPTIKEAKHCLEQEHIEQNLDRKTLRKLKKNQIRYDRSLDLHGLNQDQAHKELIIFINQSISLNHKCVLVITGKGQRNYSNKQEAIGVLRKNLPIWLNSPPLSSTIKKYSKAIPKHGGDGAFYIFL